METEGLQRRRDGPTMGGELRAHKTRGIAIRQTLQGGETRGGRREEKESRPGASYLTGADVEPTIKEAFARNGRGRGGKGGSII